jgi:hypothetical protein
MSVSTEAFYRDSWSWARRARPRTVLSLKAQAASADEQHEFSAHATRLTDTVCLRHLGQGERSPDGE